MAQSQVVALGADRMRLACALLVLGSRSNLESETRCEFEFDEGILMKHDRAKTIQSAPAIVLDSVCGMEVDPTHAVAKVEHNAQLFYFCNPHCAERFRQQPETYLNGGSAKPQPTVLSRTEAAKPTPTGEVYVCPHAPEIREVM
jgi:YHS domain-containing protein